MKIEETEKPVLCKKHRTDPKTASLKNLDDSGLQNFYGNFREGREPLVIRKKYIRITGYCTGKMKGIGGFKRIFCSDFSRFVKDFCV